MRLSCGQIEQHAVRRLAVAAGAAGLLVVGLERAREVVVDDEAQVGLVDAEAEGVGRDHQLGAAGLAAHERVLHARALGRGQPAVIDADVDALVAQEERRARRRP